MLGMLKCLAHWMMSALNGLFAPDDWDDEIEGDTATRMLYRPLRQRKTANDNRPKDQ